jgi:hypothetical protein
MKKLFALMSDVEAHSCSGLALCSRLLAPICKLRRVEGLDTGALRQHRHSHYSPHPTTPTTLVFQLALLLNMSTLHPAPLGIRSVADNATLQIPSDFELQLTKAASQYLNSCWRVELSSLQFKENKEMKVNENLPPIEVSDMIGDEMLEELRRIALCLAEAAVMTCKMDMPFI